MTTRTPTFKSAFLAGLSLTTYFVALSIMMVTDLLSLSLIVKVSAVTAVTVPTMGSPWASKSPAHKTTASKQRTIRFNIWLSPLSNDGVHGYSQEGRYR